MLVLYCYFESNNSSDEWYKVAVEMNRLVQTAAGFELSCSKTCIVVSAYSFFPYTEWSNDKVYVTVQCLHDLRDNTHVNYSVQHSVNGFVPITVDINLDEHWFSFRCENGSIPDGDGMERVKVVFKEQCKDPAVIINKHLTVGLLLELEVPLTVAEQRCNTVTVGPQSEYNVHA